MSLPEFADWLMKIGAGWLGWEPGRVEAMSMPDILTAFEGKIEMLQAMQGAPAGQNAGGKTFRPIRSVEDFDRHFA